MSSGGDSFVRVPLDVWRCRVQETARLLVLPPDHSRSALIPVLDQLSAVHNLSASLAAYLRLAQAPAFRRHLSQLAGALSHSHQAATHLTTAITGLTAAHTEARLQTPLAHAAALRSLNRALGALSPPTGEPPNPPGRTRTTGHTPVPDGDGPHPARRHP
ncbi:MULTISPECIES: hypothetical protein [unclassified Streptomyces]|uniref:hypothetical protein n=1 Tax=unclassified Streptomyces TaxID=2593676 RepID=UPI00363EFB47